MLSAPKFLSRRFSTVVPALLCCVLIVTSLPLPFANGNARAQSSDRVQKRQLPPHYALPKINDLLTEGRRLQRPDLPRPALKPSRLCGFHDKACKVKQGKEKKVGQNLKPVDHSATQVAANVRQQNWFGRIGQMVSRAFNTSPFGLTSVSAAGANSFAPSNTPPPATNAAAASAMFAPPNFTSLNEARVDPRYRAGAPGEDLFSGNVNYNLPLVSLPGRAGLDLNISLSFNSAIWIKYSGQMHFDPNYYETLTPGFRLGFPEIEGPFNLPTGETFLVTLPSGKRVEMRKIPVLPPAVSYEYEAIDGSSLYLAVNPADSTKMTLFTTGGTQFKFELPTNAYQSRCTQIKDSNGNYISIAYKSIGEPEWPLVVTDKVTDTLGREIFFNYDSNLHLLNITQEWQGHTFTWAQFDYGEKAVNPNFGSLGISGPYNGDIIPVITRVITGDGARHTFVYNSWGQAEDFWLYGEADNQRASLDYVFPAVTAPQSDCPRPTQRNDYIVNWAGATGNGIVSSYFSFDAANETYGQITDPDGVTHKEFFFTANGKRGLTNRTETWHGGSIQKFTDITWASDTTSGRFLRPRVTDTQTCDDRDHNGIYTSGTDKLSRTAISYTTPGSTTVKLPATVKQYNEGGQSVYRTTETTYVTHANYTGITRRIIGLPSMEKLYEGDSATLVAQTEYVYDSPNETGTTYLLTHSGQPRQHDSSTNGSAGNYGSNFSYRGNLTKTLRYEVVNGVASSPIETKTGYYITGSTAFSKINRDAETTIQTNIFYDDSFSVGAPNLPTYAYPTKVTDPDGHSSVAKYNYDFGAVTETVDPKSYAHSQSSPPVKAVRTYDTKGRIDKSAVWKEGQEYSHTRYIYGTDHNYVQTRTTVNVNSLDEETAVLHLLDGVGRERIVMNEHPGSQGGLSAYYRVFDKMGRVEEQSRLTEIDSSTWSPTGDDTAYLASKQFYDWKGRPTLFYPIGSNPTDPNDPKRQKIIYDGCGCAASDVTEFEGEIVPHQNGDGRRKKRIYRDAFGREAQSELLNWDGGVYSTQVNTYNVLNQLTQVSQIAGTSGTTQVTTKQYDGYGRLWKSRRPIEVGDTIYEYNNDGTVDKVTDARLAAAEFTYYNRPLVHNITYNAPSGVETTPDVQYTYDENGNRTTMSDGLGTVTYSYDSLSRMLSEDRYFAAQPGQYNAALPGTYKLAYDYNLAGQVKRVGYEASAKPGDNNYVDYVYDKVGQMTAITGSPFTGVTTYSSQMKYSAWGELRSLTSGNNYTSTYTYNERQLLQSMQYKNPGGIPLMDKTYQYHHDGRIKFSDDAINQDFDRAFRYDQVGRLEQAWTGSQARNYVNNLPIGTDTVPYHLTSQYDVWGNQLSQTGKLWSEDANPTAATYQNSRRDGWQYDAAGNVLNEGGNPYKYDAAGRNVSVGQYSQTQTQVYDGDGLVGRRDSLGSIVPIFYLRSTILGGKVIVEIDGSGTNVNGGTLRGGKLKGHVYNGETRVAIQHLRSPGYASGTPSLTWKVIDPITGTEGAPSPYGAYLEGRQEPDPLGVHVGLIDPATLPPPAADPEVPDYFGGGGSWNPLQPTVTFNGIKVSAEYAQILMESSFAVRAPAEEFIRIIRHGQPQLARWQAFGDGYQGFVPVGAKYIGNGQISYGNNGRPSLYKRAPGAPMDTNLAGINRAVGEAVLGQSTGNGFGSDLHDQQKQRPQRVKPTPTPNPCSDSILIRQAVKDSSSDGAVTKYPFMNKVAADAFNSALLEAGTVGEVRLTEMFRTTEHQTGLYNKYLEKQREWDSRSAIGRTLRTPPVPAYPPGTSAHEAGVAFDLKGQLSSEMIDIFKKHGFVRPIANDPVHFQWDQWDGKSREEQASMIQAAQLYYSNCVAPR